MGNASASHPRNTADRIAVVGGGAAGFFAAITAAEASPASSVTIYEKGAQVLTKVKVSGGGRCNVTHACFDPRDLAAHYPRGCRELRGAFHRWQPRDTIGWFAERGVELKTEPDGRVFPVTDQSQTIIDAFLKAAQEAGVELRTRCGVEDIQPLADGGFRLRMNDGADALVDQLCITSGSLKASPLTRAIEAMGHSIEPLVPSLFAFDIEDPRLQGLAGLAVRDAAVKTIPKCPVQRGPLLITHRGLSGPAILRLSAWEARRFHESAYQLQISINWMGGRAEEEVRAELAQRRGDCGKSLVKNRAPEGLPRRLWERLLATVGVSADTQWSQLGKRQETALLGQLTDCRFQVSGKTTNKEEFVTCGGVALKEIDFRTMASRLVPNLHFAGECLDIDGITGGFNFQAAWTGGRIAGEAMAACR